MIVDEFVAEAIKRWWKAQDTGMPIFSYIGLVNILYSVK